MKILAIETATEACSVALDINDSCQQHFEIAPRRHTELVLPMIDKLLQEAGIETRDLDAIAFGQGPGAFTGVRVAIGVVQGLAFAHDTPVIPISTLNALAQSYVDKHDQVAAAIDARMQEVYWGLYQKNELGLMQPVLDEVVCAPENIPAVMEDNWFGVGTGWGSYEDILSNRFKYPILDFDGEALPSAENIIALAKPAYLEGKTISVEEAMPVYLRNNVVN